MGKIGKLKKAVLPSFVIFVLCFTVIGIERQEEGEKPELTPEIQQLEKEIETVTEIGEPTAAAVESVEFLPEDTSQRFTASGIELSGNNLISDKELLLNIPMVFNASNFPIEVAPQESLFDLRGIREIAMQPGVEREVSVRSIQGFTQFLLNEYKKQNYAGIYIFVPEDAVAD